MKKLLLILAILFSSNALAVEFKGKFLQGHYIIGITEPSAKIIIDKLKALGTGIKIYDPYYKGNEIFGINVEHNLENILSEVDASIIVTGHKEFQEIDLKIFTKMKTPILIDSRGIIDTASAKDAGLVFRGLGRGI